MLVSKVAASVKVGAGQGALLVEALLNRRGAPSSVPL